LEAINGSVKHIHRSIPEFLESREVRDEMAGYLQNFEAVNAVSQLLIAELRVGSHTSDTFSRRYFSFVVSCIIVMRTKFRVDRAPYSFLESLESVLIQLWGPDVTPKPVKGIALDGLIPSGSLCLPAFTIRYRGPGLHEPVNFYIFSPLHISALIGLEEYVAWKILHDQSILNTDFETATLVSIVEHRLPFNYRGTSTQILESLFE